MSKSSRLSAPHPLQCPYCGQAVEVVAEPLGPPSERYVEDCPVCCRPWQVEVVRQDGELAIELRRDDD